MTVRRLLEAVIKILGIYYAVSAVQQIAFLLALWRAHPPREFNVPLTVIADTPVILSKAIVAAVLLFAGNAVARWLVGGRHGAEEVDRGLSRRELLYIGTCLVGLVFLAHGHPRHRQVRCPRVLVRRRLASGPVGRTLESDDDGTAASQCRGWRGRLVTDCLGRKCR